MPIHHIKKFLFGAPRLPREDAMKVFRRDHFTCRYCGLDGLQSFENWLILTVDHIHPHARGGGRHLENLVTACQPCNLIKGKRVYGSMEAAKKHVLAKRAEWLKTYHSHVKAASGVETH
ncbi:MAG: HNH endonuclease [Acidobacteria bacterium]|nr:HNH endonuclease [Acidobacteriota bacterium]